MTTLAELQEDVFSLTNHPELVVETALAIRTATFKLHLLEFWEEDRVETSISVTQTDGLYQIDVSAEISPLCRHIEYVQKLADYKFLTKIHPTDVFDDYGNMKNNVFYRVGSKLNCRSDTADIAVLVGYLKAPVTSGSGYSSWIADLYQHIIAIEAASIVFNGIGETDLSKKLQVMQAENLALLKINHLPQG